MSKVLKHPLLLTNQKSLWELQNSANLPLNIYPFTLEDEWAKKILVNFNNNYPSLDYIPITKNSSKTVHAVIIGFDEQAQALARNIAFVAHYPNYNSQTQLRTCITIIDKNISQKCKPFIEIHKYLFENSFYRINNQEHKPMYYGKRADFVDIEWEFLETDIENYLSESQIVTIYVSGDNDEENLKISQTLPKEIPIFVRQSVNKSLPNLPKNVYLFGMLDSGYDVNLPLVRMAKYLNYFYDCSYSGVEIPEDLSFETVENAWRKLPYKMQISNICNVMIISTKLRCVGMSFENIREFTQEEIEILSEMEHNRWSVERLIMGNRPCTDSEKSEIRENIQSLLKNPNLPNLKKQYKNKGVHYDLCAYDELEIDATGKNVKVYDYDLTACIPKIIKHYLDYEKR